MKRNSLKVSFVTHPSSTTPSIGFKSQKILLVNEEMTS